jgi:hypothetical protein
MTEVAPQVVPIFATPFGLASVPGADALNPALASLLSQRATPEGADMANHQAHTYQSRPNLFDWTEEPVSWIRAGLIDLVSGFARSINEFSDEQFAGFRVQARSWFTIVRPDGCVPSHSHANAAWCALYCVAAPQVAADRFDSGVLRLHESYRPSMFTDATNSATQLPYRPGHSTWRPVPGQLVIFPASIVHEIALLRGTGELILVTASMRFLAPGQTGIPLW